MASKQPLAYLASRVPDDALARVESQCRVRRYEGRGLPPKPELLAALSDADGLLGSAMLPIDAEALRAAPRLRVVSNIGVGYSNVDLATATERGVLVCNTPGVLTNAVADLTLTLIVSLARRLSESERFVREGRWTSSDAMGLGTDVRGKTLGIVGFGRIGRAVAERAGPFGLRLLFADIARDVGEVGLAERRELDELLRESDFVSLPMNLPPETERLIGERALSLMKASA